MVNLFLASTWTPFIFMKSAGNRGNGILSGSHNFQIDGLEAKGLPEAKTWLIRKYKSHFLLCAFVATCGYDLRFYNL